MTLLTPLFIHLFCGAIAAIIGGLIFKKISLGLMGNVLAGMVGGLLVGQGINILSHFDFSAFTYVTQVAKGVAGGGLCMIIMGFIRYSVGTDR